jgi:hypothetical protein
MRMRKKTKRTNPGSSPAARIVRCAVALLVLGAFGAPAGAGKEGKPPAAYAVVAGTVFRDSGFSLAGAEVELAACGAPDVARKFKKVKQIADSRGEFAFRVPATPAEYKVSAKASGYQAEEKQVSVSGEQRFDVFFRQAPASK